MKYNKRMLLIIIISVTGILYVPLRIVLLKNNITPISGLLTEVEKTYTRIPSYKFKTSNYQSVFYNSGKGFLSKFKNDKVLLYKGINKEITFYINEKDFSKLDAGQNIKYIGLQKKNILIDLFYYYYSDFNKVFFSLIFLFIMCLNVYGLYIIKTKIFEYFLIIYLCYLILILIL